MKAVVCTKCGLTEAAVGVRIGIAGLGFFLVCLGLILFYFTHLSYILRI